MDCRLASVVGLRASDGGAYSLWGYQMSQDQFPLIKRCFPELTVWSANQCVELEKMLEKAVRVYGTNLNDNGIAAGDDPQWFLSIKREKNDTHTALLIGIEPITPKLEVHVDRACPPDEFWLITQNGKKHKFRIDDK